MIEITNVSRRDFLQGMLSAGALVLSARMISDSLWAQSAAPAAGSPVDNAVLHPSVFVGIETDGTVHIMAHRSEMGTTSRTSLPMILADELDADWTRVKVEQALGDSRYGSQDTDGSHSVREFYGALRDAGATARMMLVRAAAEQWGVPASECAADLHTIAHSKSNRRAGYGELAAAAAKLPVPKREDLQYKPKEAWRYIGKGMASYDLVDICSGKARYGMDASMPGMVYASVEHPPVLGGKVKSYDEKAPLTVRGVRQTLTIEPFAPPHKFQPLGGIAVIADNTWAAFRGRKKLNAVWENGGHASYDSEQYKKQLQETARKPGKVVRNIGDVDAVFKQGGKLLEAEYYAPHLAHASMEPPAAVAEFKDGMVTAWAPSQNPKGCRRLSPVS